MKTQQFLRECGLSPSSALMALSEKYGICVTRHHAYPICILNYSQIDSEKRNEIVRECRSLILNSETFDVVARSFPRFFNYGECPDIDKKFDWDNFSMESKEDGSLMLLWQWNGIWHCSTRKSFADGKIAAGCDFSWEEVFFNRLDEKGLDYLNPAWTYVFELTGPLNKVVRQYEKTTLCLLSAFNKHNGAELHDITLDNVATFLGVRRPERYEPRSYADICRFLDEHPEATFEGVVLRDRNGLRLKVKNPRYVALHHLCDNGNVCNPKRLVPLILSGEIAEVTNHFDEALPAYFDITEKLYGAHGRMMAVWEVARGKQSQKDFATFVTKHTPYSSILFEARKHGKEPKEVWLKSEDLILKRICK